MATNTEELKKLKKELNELKKLLAQATETSVNQNNNVPMNNDRDILFTSLYPGILNLSTEGNGVGDIYTFNEFGSELNIPYQEARQIIRKNRRFATEGYFFISDDDIIKSERLESDYKTILDKNKILNLFEVSGDKFRKIFENMTGAQQDILHQIVVKKLKNNENVDMNVVYVINETLKCDVLDESKNDKKLEEKE